MVTAFVTSRLSVCSFPPAGENPFYNFLKSINMKCLLVFLAGYTLLGQPAHAIAQGAGATRDQPAITRAQSGVTAAQGTGDANDKANDRGAAKSREQVAADHSQLKACCQKIARDVQRIYYLNNRNGKMRLVVRGIYTRGKSLFFSLKPDQPNRLAGRRGECPRLWPSCKGSPSADSAVCVARRRTSSRDRIRPLYWHPAAQYPSSPVWIGHS